MKHTLALLLLALTSCGDDTGSPGDLGSSDEPSAMAGMTAAHNAVRHQADASMADLTWSSTLADVAQDYAERCIWAHSGNDYGENLYAETGGPSTPAQVVADWAAEEADYNYTTNTCNSGRQCGHYTQIVWADTERVGCGRATCTTGSPFPDSRWFNWVCNYSPPGNYSGQKPY